MNLEQSLSINRKFSLFFKASLEKSAPAKDYVSSRLNRKVSSAFSIGYCDSKVLDFIKEQAFDEATLERLGLIAMNDEGDYYPVFLNRIIVPIFSTYGIVGFSGRCLYPSQQKYINTKKTLLYNKSELLYPLAFSKKHIFSADCCIIVEGYFDALSLISNGFRNVVALCGTSLSTTQINLIRRWTTNVKLMLDGDEAGRSAAKKIHATLLEKGMNSGIIYLPEGLDPDVFIRDHGIEKLKLLEENA